MHGHDEDQSDSDELDELESMLYQLPDDQVTRSGIKAAEYRVRISCALVALRRITAHDPDNVALIEWRGSRARSTRRARSRPR